MSGNEAVQRLARTHRLSDRHIFNILKRKPVATVNMGGALQLRLLGGAICYQFNVALTLPSVRDSQLPTQHAG